MRQLTVCHNLSLRTRSEVPFLLVVQSDLLEDLATRVVVPLYRKAAQSPPPITRLMPELMVTGVPVIMQTPQLAGVALRDLGEAVARLDDQREVILAALDLLLTGF